jgi:hypothetical protein
MTNETWEAVCDSLKTHPTLQVLNMQWSLAGGPLAPLAPAALKSQIQALVDMLKVNTLIHTIYLDSCHSEHELCRGSVIPYLETNRLRPRVRAIQKACPIAYRAKVLGRALLLVPMQIAFGCSYQGIRKLPFCREARRPRRLRTSLHRLLLPLLLLLLLISSAANVATPTACQRRKAHP